MLLRLCGGGALIELVDATGRVHELLLAREQRMARRADLNRDFGDGRTRRKTVAARAVDAGFREPFWVNLLFHSLSIITEPARGPETKVATGALNGT